MNGYSMTYDVTMYESIFAKMDSKPFNTFN